MSPDFLAIGHVAKDLSPGGSRIGGTAAYAALTAARMGVASAVVTSGGPELDLQATLPAIRVSVVPSPVTTTFLNDYDRMGRTQFLRSVAEPIAFSDIPRDWRSSSMVLLCPLAGEVSYDLAPGLRGSVVLASIQGWLRRWDDRGRVSRACWEGKEVLPYVDGAVVSIDDISDPRLIDEWKEMVGLLIVTKESDGADLHWEGDWHHVEPFPAREVDPTGAGDVFAAALLVRFHETGDPLEAARFASCAASFCVEAEGTEAIPTRDQVEERLRDGLGTG